jgi:UDP-N-acetyl-D-glucosamine dehydrogenase
MENIFRSVNIALVNELKQVFASMDIDIWEVIEAAKTKPFGFMPFYPGPGLGGHCIPIDPFYLTWKAREYGKSTKFIELAGEVNTSMPDYVVTRITEVLNEQGKPIKGSKILIIGLSYKADVDDCRESPSFVVMDKLSNLGSQISYYDPHLPEVPQTREHSHWAGFKSVDWDKEIFRKYDLAVIMTAHKIMDYEQLGQWVPMIVDTRNAMSGIKTGTVQIFNA